MAWSDIKKLTQTYSVKVRVDRFYERIAELIEEEINNEVDSEYLEIDEADTESADFVGKYSCECKCWYEPQTMWEPEEYEIDREYISDNRGNKWVKSLIEKHSEELIHLLDIEVEEDADAVEIEGN